MKRKRAAVEGELGDYEQARQARMESNKKRMLELGLQDIKKCMVAHVRKRIPTPKKSAFPLANARRSARIQNNPPPSYCEQPKKILRSKGRTHRDASQAGTGGPKLEIYTEEHEKLLGSATEEWQLFEDGYAANGSRVYSSDKGKTCHQCRQKTMGLRTHCNECESLHGEFCGDCLYMRYGENVKETMKNKSWKCPVCRDICNCSICRHRKGWAPTGSLYRKAIALGYKSVAHFLVYTRRGEEKTPPAPTTPNIITEIEEPTGRKDGSRRMLKYDKRKARQCSPNYLLISDNDQE